MRFCFSYRKVDFTEIYFENFRSRPRICHRRLGVVDYKGSSFKTLAYGAITTKAGVKPERRLQIIYDELTRLLKLYKPEAMAVEELFFNTNQKTAIVVAEARGVILLAAQNLGIEIFEYTPLQVKQSVVGYGRAEKSQVITMTTKLLGLKEAPKPDDAADALAIAVCHAHTGSSRIAAFFN